MQGQPVQLSFPPIPVRSAVPVLCITQDWMSQRIGVPPDLVRPSRQWFAQEERTRASGSSGIILVVSLGSLTLHSTQQCEFREGLLFDSFDDQRFINENHRLVPLPVPPNQGQILFLTLSNGGVVQDSRRGGIKGKEHDARGSMIQAVDGKDLAG